MKEKATAKRKIIYYVILAASVLLLTAATVLTVYFVAGGKGDLAEVPDQPKQEQPNEPDTPTGPTEPDQPTGPSQPSQPSGPSEGDNKPSGGDGVKFVNPVSVMNMINDFEFYHNKTVNWFYEHEGVDIAADEGANVFAMADGKVESVTYDELHCTEITVNHGNGLKTVYRFVTLADGIAPGATVTKGQKIATVAEAKGEEYKDGPHLHLEVHLNGATVDPTAYLTTSEK